MSGGVRAWKMMIKKSRPLDQLAYVLPRPVSREIFSALVSDR
jgi:hypothetical protein